MGRTMNKIIDFESYQGKKGRAVIPYPTLEEVHMLNLFTSGLGKQNRMVDIRYWNGSCWKAMFDELEKHASTIGCDSWDVFAVFITKVMGTKFGSEEDDFE